MYAAGPNEFRDFAKEYEIEKQNEIEMKVRSNFFKLNSTDIDDLMVIVHSRVLWLNHCEAI